MARPVYRDAAGSRILTTLQAATKKSQPRERLAFEMIK